MLRNLARLCLLFFVFSCSHDSDFNNQTYLFTEYISSYSGGVVSVGSQIKVKLTRPLPDSIINSLPDNLFKFSPAIKGTELWEDNRTITFQPDKPLKGDQEYEVRLRLNSLYPAIVEERQLFQFTFKTLKQNFEVDFEGIRYYEQENLKNVFIRGSIRTADSFDMESLQNAFSAKQEGKDLDIQFNSVEGNKASFEINHIIRSETTSKVQFEVDGHEFGADRVYGKELAIPSLKDFRVISSSIHRGGDNYISVVFSDPLDPEQSLDGMVRLLDQQTPRIVADKNLLKIYPAGNITTEVDLLISAGIRNVGGYELPESYTSRFKFTQVNPAVKLVGETDKSILPTGKDLKFHFKAIGLKAVDITVVRIFENNVLQYLQGNDLGGTRQMNRVGRPVARKTLSLNTSGVTNLNDWNNYSIDLTELFSSTPGAIYQLEIGFKKEYSMFFCTGNEETDVEIPEISWDYEPELNWDNYSSYYNSDYDWRERDNPCHVSYYGRRRSVNKIVHATDLGLVAKRGDDGTMMVFVSSLSSAKPISGAIVTAYDFQQQPIGSTETTDDGSAQLILSRTPYVITAESKKERSYLKVDDGSSLSMSFFNVSGNRVQRGLKGFVYSERGVHRPGDTLHTALMLEDLQQRLPDNYPVIMELFQPNNQLFDRKINARGEHGLYRFDFVTSTDAPTGNWYVIANIGGVKFRKTMRIETIKPNRLKVHLDFDKDQFSASDNRITGNLHVQWLTGATARNLKTQFESRMSPLKTTFDKFEGYSFDDPTKRLPSEPEVAFTGRVDNSGEAKFEMPMPNGNEAPGKVRIKLYGKAFEEGGDFSTSIHTVEYSPYSSFAGLKVPEGDKRGMLLTDEDHIVHLALVDKDGKPIDGNLDVEVFKLRWRWWWDNSYEEVANYVRNSQSERILERSVPIADGKGSVTLRINRPEWGRYLVRVKDPNSGHSTGKIVFIDWPGWAGKGKRGNLDGAAMLDFASDKQEYNVGDEITLRIPSTAGNRILLSLESGSRILQSQWFESKEGTTEVSFSATPEMSPNIYANVTMIQPYVHENNDLPIRMYGVTSLKVVDPSTQIHPVIEMASELRPEETFGVRVSEKSGRPMYYTLAIVDEGLLDITNYKTPDPWSAFYARESLGIKTWDSYDDVLGATAIENEYMLKYGGDDEIEPQENKQANRFKPVVKFLGPFHLESGETQEHRVKMPQYIGSVKTMVIASHAGAYGATHKITPVRQPVMVMTTLPRVAGPGETMKLPVNVFTLKDGVGKVDVTVETVGTLKTIGVVKKTVHLPGTSDTTIFFDVKALEKRGIGKVKVTATSKALKASYDIALNVIPRNSITTSHQSTIIEEANHWDVAYSSIGLPGDNSGILEISTMPPLNLGERLEYLIQYPHGCVEQTTSAVFAQLYVPQLLKIDASKSKRITQNIQAAIRRLKLFQLSSGGFSYWPGQSFFDYWGTNYAGHFLIEAKNKGYNVPSEIIQSWISFQSDHANRWESNKSNRNTAFTQAYRLYGLALAGQPNIGAMNRLKNASELTAQASKRLAAAYAIAGYKEEGKELLTKGSNQSNAENYRYSYGSELRNQAMALETFLALDKKVEAYEILADISRELSSGSWHSTQTTAYSILAIGKYAEKSGITSEMNVRISIDETNVDVVQKKYIVQVEIPTPDKPHDIAVHNNGVTPVFARLVKRGIPVEGKELDTSEGLDIKVRYQSMDGTILSPDKIKQGTDFKAVVHVKHPGIRGDYDNIALQQIFPSGWEIINSRLNGNEQASDYDYMDIRDDRVMHYFGLRSGKTKSFIVRLNAAYQGRYYLPAIVAEAMYDNTIIASKKGQWVEVVK